MVDEVAFLDVLPQRIPRYLPGEAPQAGLPCMEMLCCVFVCVVISLALLLLAQVWTFELRLCKWSVLAWFRNTSQEMLSIHLVSIFSAERDHSYDCTFVTALLPCVMLTHLLSVRHINWQVAM